MAAVIPIYKNGAKDDPCNYRPISLLGGYSKLLERVVNKRLTKYLEKNSLLSDRQFGFRQGKSTEDAVTLLTDMVVTHLDQGRSCVGVFLDLAKAFDTVSIPILLRKLSALGIRGLSLNWFSSYLSGRKQCVQIGNQSSDLRSVVFGVPQGSILGPSLFISYIHDIMSIKLENIAIVCYAVDTAILFYGISWHDVYLSVVTGLHKLQKWLNNNILRLKPQKRS